MKDSRKVFMSLSMTAIFCVSSAAPSSVERCKVADELRGTILDLKLRDSVGILAFCEARHLLAAGYMVVVRWRNHSRPFSETYAPEATGPL